MRSFLPKPAASFRAAAAVAAAAFLTAHSAHAADIPSAVAEKLASEKYVLQFSIDPEGLALLPAFPGDADFRGRHAALKPYFTQEGLFILPAACPPVDEASALRILAAVPSLGELSYPDERTGKPSRLLTEAVLIGEPVSRGGTLSFVVRTADVDFGTARFEISLIRSEDRVELRMVNMDSLHFLIFPSVGPGKALVDLIYFPREKEPLIYLAWSVRSLIRVPGFIEVERPLRYRALAMKDWYVRQLENCTK